MQSILIIDDDAAISPFVPVLTCGDLTLDTSSHEVRISGVTVTLTRTEYAILQNVYNDI